jgi:hypothetical protein
MVAIRIFTLLLALGFSTSAFAITAPYTAAGSGTNNVSDITEGSCDSVQGCPANDGTLCSAAPEARCDVQRVPAGRCSGGNACLWPVGAGTCLDNAGTPAVDESKFACLPDLVADHGATTGTFVSGQCGAALCDMASNLPACECQGSDPAAPKWEGTICSLGAGNPQARCSDGDVDRAEAGGPSGLATSLFNGTAVGVNNAGGASAGFGIRKGPTSGGDENATGNHATLQRNPGTGLANAPTTPILDLAVTVHYAWDDYTDATADFFATGVRRFSQVVSTYWGDSGFGSGANNAAGLNNAIVVQVCDPPEGWSMNKPVSGKCAAPNGTVDCIDHVPCDALTPGTLCTSSLLYCYEDAKAHSGFMWTRDLTSTEVAAAAGACPPDCKTSVDHTMFELKAIIDAGTAPNDPRGGVQLALDHMEGAKAGKGDVLSVQPLVSQTWLPPADDPRCFVGGDPNRSAGDITKTGRCSDSPTICDPDPASAHGAASVQCGVGSYCAVCGGTYNKDYVVLGGDAGPTGLGGYFDAASGSTLALPVGYDDGTVLVGLSNFPLTAGRIGIVSDIPSDVRVPLMIVATSQNARSEGRDATCPSVFDNCELGATTGGGGDGIGVGGTFTTAETPTHDPAGGTFTTTITWAAEDGGVEDPTLTFIEVVNWGPGPDGIPGCLGDNHSAIGATPCDAILGGASPGSTGSDDLPITADYSPDAPVTRNATAAKFLTTDPAAITPSYNTAAALGDRDLTLTIAGNLDFLNKTGTTWCPLAGSSGGATGGAVKGSPWDCSTLTQTFCTDEGGVCSSDASLCTTHPACGCADGDGDGICDVNDACPTFANSVPLSDTNLNDVPDDCQCGDTNDDGIIAFSDGTRNFQCAASLVLSPLPLCDVTINDTNGDSIAAFSDGTATFVAAACASASDPGAGCPLSLTCSRRPVGGVPPDICLACADLGGGAGACDPGLGCP